MQTTEATAVPPPATAAATTTRTLVCLMGSVRGGAATWRSLDRHLLQPNNADLALMISARDDVHALAPALAARARYIFRQPEPADWGQALDAIAAKVRARRGTARWAAAMPDEAGAGDRDDDRSYFAKKQRSDATDWRELLRTGRFFAPAMGEGPYPRDPATGRRKALDGGVFGGVRFDGRTLPGSGAIVGAQRAFVAETLVEADPGDGDPRSLLARYERFVVTRTDQHFLCDLDLDALAPESAVFVPLPKSEDYGGYCDRLVVCSRADIARCLDTMSAVVAHPARFMRRRWMFHSSESLLFTRWRQSGLAHRVKRFARTFFTARDAHDASRSVDLKAARKHERFVEALGVWAKYPREHEAAKASCDRIIED